MLKEKIHYDVEHCMFNKAIYDKIVIWRNVNFNYFILKSDYHFNETPTNYRIVGINSSNKININTFHNRKSEIEIINSNDSSCSIKIYANPQDIIFCTLESEFVAYADKFENECLNKQNNSTISDVLDEMTKCWKVNTVYKKEKVAMDTNTRISKIYFNKTKKVTTVLWSDNIKTIVKLHKGEKWSKETAVAYAIAKRYAGSGRAFNKLIEEKGIDICKKKKMK